LSTIAIIKGKELYKLKRIRALQKKAKAYHFIAFNLDRYEMLYQADLEPDLIIVDSETGINLHTLMNDFKKTNTKIAVSLPEVDSHQLTELFKLPLHGYFLANEEIGRMTRGITFILQGMTYTHPHIAKVLLDEYIKMVNPESYRPNDLLTKQEWAVLERLVEGKSNCTIAETLVISEKTVNNHVASILSKLNVPNRTNAVSRAMKYNWV